LGCVYWLRKMNDSRRVELVKNAQSDATSNGNGCIGRHWSMYNWRSLWSCTDSRIAMAKSKLFEYIGTVDPCFEARIIQCLQHPIRRKFGPVWVLLH
jgi:hypothetical protein